MFYFYKKQKCECFFDLIQQNIQLFIAHDTRLFNTLPSFITEIELFNNEIGKKNIAAQLAVFNSECEAIDKGYNPITQVKLISPKRDLQFILLHKIIVSTNDLLQKEYAEITTKINQAKGLIENMVLMAIQNEIIDLSAIESVPNQLFYEKLWKSLSLDTSLSIVQKRILLIVSKIDCIIILEETINQIRQVVTYE